MDPILCLLGETKRWTYDRHGRVMVLGLAADAYDLGEVL